MNWITKPLVILNSSKAMNKDETVVAIKKFMASELVDVGVETDETLNMSDIQKRAIVSEDVLHKLKTIYNIIEIEDSEGVENNSEKTDKYVRTTSKRRKSLS